MKLLRWFIGGLAIVVGIIWILQGFNVLPPGTFLSHSFMMGQRVWAYAGIAAVAVGLLVALLPRRRRP